MTWKLRATGPHLKPRGAGGGVNTLHFSEPFVCQMLCVSSCTRMFTEPSFHLCRVVLLSLASHTRKPQSRDWLAHFTKEG
jgi:hypothetical protein